MNLNYNEHTEVMLKNRYLQQQNSTLMAEMDEPSLYLYNIKKEAMII